MEPLGVAFLAHTPPPLMGPSVAARTLLRDPPADLRLYHIQLSDRRPLETLNRADFRNVLFGLWCWMKLLALLLRRWPRVVYLPLTQTAAGFLRDAGFLLLARLFRRKILLHFHGGAFAAFRERFRHQRLLRFCLRGAHAVVLGERFRPEVADLVAEVHVVPNGTEEISAGQRNGNRVLFLSNDRPGKGLATLEKAIPLVKAQRSDVEFVVAGAGTPRGAVDGEEKRKLLAEADLFVLPTELEEGQPLSIVEALAAGLPVVATPKGCIPDMVRDNLNGRLVPPGDPAALAGAVLALLPHAPELGSASRALYRACFTSEAFRNGIFAAMRSAALDRGR